MNETTIIDKVNKLEALMFKMQKTHSSTTKALKIATRFIQYIKTNHGSIFDRALEHSNKGE